MSAFIDSFPSDFEEASLQPSAIEPTFLQPSSASMRNTGSKRRSKNEDKAEQRHIESTSAPGQLMEGTAHTARINAYDIYIRDRDPIASRTSSEKSKEDEKNDNSVDQHTELGTDCASGDIESLPVSLVPLAQRVIDSNEEQIVQERVNRLLQEEHRTIPLAQVVNEDESLRGSNCGRKRFVVICIGAFVVVVVVVAVTLAIKLRPAADSEETTAPARGETLAPTTSLAPTPSPIHLIDLLSSASFDGGEALRTPGTPQNKAFTWLNDSSLDTYGDQQRLQRYTLATLYYSTKGVNWTTNTNWLDDGDECGRWWQSNGLLQCTETGALTRIGLSGNNLQGTIPQEVALLSNSLELINVFGNNLTGPLPNSIGQLTNLNWLDLASNRITGIIPSPFSQLTALHTLRLFRNLLSGTIPAKLFQLQTLSSLRLGENDLEGIIPSEIASLTGLEELSIPRSRLTGSISTSIVRLTFLKELDLRSNTLTGKIPIDIADLSRLQHLEIAENRLTGSIPASISGMSSLKRLSLYGNELTGAFTCPAFISKCLVSCDDNGDKACRSLQ